jgi:hypothetical protein
MLLPKHVHSIHTSSTRKVTAANRQQSATPSGTSQVMIRQVNGNEVTIVVARPARKSSTLDRHGEDVTTGVSGFLSTPGIISSATRPSGSANSDGNFTATCSGFRAHLAANYHGT